MMAKLKVGCVGNGGMGRVHVASYLDDDRAEIVALCDIVPEKMDMIAEKYGLGDLPKYTDYRDMIDREELDIVDICTPNKFHSDIAVYALEHGVNVFCEKPDAVSVDEVLRMKEASEKSGKLLMVMRNNRYYGNSVYMKKFISEGRMGEIYAGRCGWIRRRGIPGKRGWFTTKELSGGGPLIDLGVHMIDLSMWLMGNPRPVAVVGSTYSKFADSNADPDSLNAQYGETQAEGIYDVEDLAMGYIRFDNGASLQIEFSWASNVEKEHRFVELRGTKAGCTWDDDGLGTLEVYGEEADGTLYDLKPVFDTAIDGHAKNIRHFLDVLTDGREPDFKPQQGVDMIRILRAVYESAETGKEVLL